MRYTLEDVVCSFPKAYKEFDVFVLEEDDLYWIGCVSSVYDLYAGKECCYVDKKNKQIWLKKF